MRGSEYFFKRIGSTSVTILATLVLNFLLFRILPGSAVARMSRIPNASPELKHALEVEFGLNKPLWQQLLLYFKQLIHGNLGISYVNHQPVLHNLVIAFGNTIPMVGIGTIIALVIGITVGVFSAINRDTFTDHFWTGTAVAFYAFPTQFLGLMILLVFAGVLPSAGMENPFLLHPTLWQAFVDHARHLFMPVATLVLTLYAENALIARSAMLETLGDDYILTARAKGLPRRRIVLHHALRNALLPIVTMSALSLGSIVSGAILVEVIFSWPGIGRALYQAVLHRDYPMLQGGFLAIAIVVTLSNLAGDLFHFYLDPRVTA